MKDILELLHQDHINYARLLSLLEKEINIIRSGGNANYLLLYDILCYLTEYPDVVHHPLEESIFARLPEFTTDQQLLDDVAALGEEHQEIYRRGDALKSDIHKIVGGEIVGKDELFTDATGYLDLLRSHMDKEEGQVFRSIRSNLDSEQLDELNRIWNETEDPLFGPVVQEQFSQLHLGILRMASTS